MKLLTFLAERFAWEPFSQTLEDADNSPPADSAEDAVVVWFHMQASDSEEGRRNKVFKKALKHIKWLANKKGFQTIVLHSFAHLGGENAEPGFAEEFCMELKERLENTGYVVKTTPFGWFCSWELKVYGESLAKVWKEF
jgi:hypothetical protein